MKQKILLLSILFCVQNIIFAQTDFEKYKQEQQQKFEEYQKENQEKLKRYKDSLNLAYSEFLKKEWKNYNLTKPEPPIKTPIPTPPVFDNTKPKPEPEKIPNTPITPKPEPRPFPTPKPEPKPEPEKTIHSTFFGTDIQLQKLSKIPTILSDISNNEIGIYWAELTEIQYLDIANDALRIKSELNLNDWGLYQLLGTIFKTHKPNGSVNEQTIFTVFMLNQMNYKAKIGKCNDELIPVVAFQNDVNNCNYFLYGGNSDKYYVIDPTQKYNSVSSCSADYVDAVNTMTLNIKSLPKFTNDVTTKSLNFNNQNYPLRYNRNLVEFYKDYPCVEFNIYAETPLDINLEQSMRDEMEANIKGQTQTEAINWLLHFVQSAFDYKTDHEQFGYEKWFFAEETINSSFSDCEDRAILFAQLVRNFLKMPVVLIHYPGYHLSTAVKFNDQSIQGDYVLVDNQKYLICDPTYINANLGMTMPQLKNIAVEIIKLK